jgi:hypothetical protein
MKLRLILFPILKKKTSLECFKKQPASLACSPAHVKPSLNTKNFKNTHARI